jgi:hypothetical protein
MEDSTESYFHMECEFQDFDNPLLKNLKLCLSRLEVNSVIDSLVDISMHIISSMKVIVNII